MRIAKYLSMALLAVLVVGMGWRGLQAASSFMDYTQGQLIPTALIADHTFAGTSGFSGKVTATGGIVPTVAAKSASFTLSDAVDNYYMTSAGGAITVTLPTPGTLTSGKTWNLCLETAGNAVTLNAGTFSINGAVTDAQMDAAGDCETIMALAGGYALVGKNIH